MKALVIPSRFVVSVRVASPARHVKRPAGSAAARAARRHAESATKMQQRPK